MSAESSNQTQCTIAFQQSRSPSIYYIFRILPEDIQNLSYPAEEISIQTKYFEMKISTLLLSLAFLTATSYADEFPNPCKRSEIPSGTRLLVRIAAQRPQTQISAKFAASVSVSLECEQHIGAASTHSVFTFLTSVRQVKARDRPCNDDEICYCQIPTSLDGDCGRVINGYNGYETKQWEHNCENYKAYMACKEKTKGYCSADRPWDWDIPCQGYQLKYGMC
jgi:hypothetical protein